ncbi:MAG TPA: hypothetical protein VJ972_13775 [Anaerolineales bacterium]|nr:hypothetical protein [Anaerolineales bacterium]
MPSTEIIIPAIAGITTAIISSLVGAWVTYRALKRDYQNKYQMELINRQIAACETLWSVLSVASRSKGNNHVLCKNNGKFLLNIEKGIELHDNVVNTVNSQHGLYFSRELRQSVFDLRDFIENEINFDLKDEYIPVSNTKANKLDGYVQNIRVAIRKELRLEDINAAKEGPL